VKPEPQERWAEIERLVDQILDAETEVRPELLARIRREHPALAAQVEELVQAIINAETFLNDTAPTYAAPLIARIFEASALAPGTQLGSYEIVKELGRGGTATVYLANDRKHGRQVAVKVPHPELASLLGPERFLREIRIAAQLQHPNILPLHDSGEVEGVLYYVMPYVEGESLRQCLTRVRPLPPTKVLDIACQVGNALAYAHDHGVVHCDIKPENILLQSGHALVADFGIARAIDAAAGNRLSETGLAIGTPAYMSPEQAAADPRIDGRTDIYSLGSVTYEMLGGHVPPNVEPALTKALAKNPADRFGTAAEFVEALKQPERTSRPRFSSSLSHSRQWMAVGGAVLLVLVAVSWLASGPQAHAEELSSIAVLPCQGLPGDTMGQYVGDQWTEELIDKLSRVASLRPKSWLSMRRFRNTSKDSREIAKELGAGTLVRCSVAETSDSLRLRVQVIAANEDHVLWSRQYGRDLTAESINEVQAEAVQEIAARVGAPPSSIERTRLGKPQTDDLAALQAYRLGRQFLGSLDVTRSISQFEQAIARDSLFAAAYVGLADASIIDGQQDGRPTREYMPRAVQLILKALALDPTLADAHTLLGDYLLLFNQDWSSAETEYRRAVQLDPNSVIAHMWYGMVLVTVGHSERGLAELERAVELDPSFPLAHIQLGSGLRVAGQYQRAIQEIHAALRISPDNPVAHLHLGLIHLQQGHADSAVAAFEKGVQLGARWADARSRLANAYGVAGQRTKALEILNEILRKPPLDALHVARIHVGLGDKAEAMRWLQRAYQENSLEILTALGGQDPAFHPLRADPRYQALRTRIGMDKW
jgi:serine/threonine protein kinase/tetratricopeptide (TPR) repeat protein